MLSLTIDFSYLPSDIKSSVKPLIPSRKLSVSLSFGVRIKEVPKRCITTSSTVNPYFAGNKTIRF